MVSLPPPTPSVPQPCPSCGSEQMREFCPDCGEKRFRIEDFSTTRLLSRFFGGLFNFDSRFWRTMASLLRRPGQLTAEAVRGRRQPYMRPVQAFFVCNLIYFLLQPWTGVYTLVNTYESHLERQSYSAWVSELVEQRFAAAPEQQEDFEIRMDTRLGTASRSLLILLVPMIALICIPVLWPRRRYWALHLHFALEFLCFVMTYVLILWMLVIKVLMYDLRVHQALLGDAMDSETILTAIGLWLPVAWWSASSFRSIYGFSLWQSWLRASAFTAVLLWPIYAFRLIVFLTCYWLS